MVDRAPAQPFTVVSEPRAAAVCRTAAWRLRAHHADRLQPGERLAAVRWLRVAPAYAVRSIMEALYRVLNVGFGGTAAEPRRCSGTNAAPCPNVAKGLPPAICYGWLER